MQTKALLLKIVATCVAAFGLATANAQLVFDADSNVTGTLNNPVTAWSDIGSTYTLAPLGTGPTLLNSGFNYLAFNQTPLLNASVPATILGETQGAVFMVLRGFANDRSALTWMDESVAAYQRLVQVSRTASDIYYVQGNLTGGSTDFINADEGNVADGSWHVLTLVRNGNGGTIRLDGTPLPSLAGDFAGPLPQTATGKLTVGGAPFNAPGDVPDRWTGDIAEIQIFSAVPGDINAIEQALGAEYGLTVVPEPSEYAMIFGLACVAGAVALRYRRQQLAS